MTFDARTAFEGQPRRELMEGTSALSIETELRPGERVLWSGQPHRHGWELTGIIWTLFCVFAVLFSLLVTLGSAAGGQPLGVVWEVSFRYFWVLSRLQTVDESQTKVWIAFSW